MRYLLFAGLLLLAASLYATATASCGDTESSCPVDAGSYHALAPSATAPPAGYPALLYFHGAGGSGVRALKNQALTKTLNARGYLLIAPNAIPRPGGRFGPVWSFIPNRPTHRDEQAFVRAVLTDATARFRLDRKRVLMSGFSIGGSLTWYLACAEPDLAAAYAPVGGGFWRPPPTRCTGPVRLLHTHGWTDKTVPLEGRPLAPSIAQGDIFAGLLLWRATNGCDQYRADTFATGNAFWQRRWTSCTPGSALELVLHPRGHRVPSGWATLALDWFEQFDSAAIR